VPDDVTATSYLSSVESGLETIDRTFLNGAKGGGGSAPLVFYQAGVDPLREDRLGRLSLTRSDLKERNALVYAWCNRIGAKCVVTMGGGYARPIDPSVEAHVDVFLQAAEANAVAALS
jgi:acetoin utilization deacetylase AcuC-like enzyme